MQNIVGLLVRLSHQKHRFKFKLSKIDFRGFKKCWNGAEIMGNNAELVRLISGRWYWFQ